MRKNGDSVVLLLGDVVVFLGSLWLMLTVRHLTLPSWEFFNEHFVPFAILFAVWIVVFFIAGLYERYTVLFQRELPPLLLKTQLINIVIAVLFFYLIPYFGITPKTNLFIYLVISFGLVLVWRLYGYGFIGTKRKYPALLIGAGEEMEELRDELNSNPYSELDVVATLDLDHADAVDMQRDLVELVYSEEIRVAAVELSHPAIEPFLPHLYNLMFSNVQFFDLHRLYEETFRRVPLSLLRYTWFLENISSAPRFFYDSLKRLTDIIVALTLGPLSLLLYPFIILAIKLEDGKEIFSFQTRIGQNNGAITIVKFRTMAVANDNAQWGKIENYVTNVGRFLRRSRLDELPQLWNVLKGDLSLIGPRPEFPEVAQEYTRMIPFYNVRHLIKPGLSGWAQLYHRTPPRHSYDFIETQRKLSYDLYYLTNRSFFLDVMIGLKTIKILVARIGGA